MRRSARAGRSRAFSCERLCGLWRGCRSAGRLRVLCSCTERWPAGRESGIYKKYPQSLSQASDFGRLGNGIWKAARSVAAACRSCILGGKAIVFGRGRGLGFCVGRGAKNERQCGGERIGFARMGHTGCARTGCVGFAAADEVGCGRVGMVKHYAVR